MPSREIKQTLSTQKQREVVKTEFLDKKGNTHSRNLYEK